MMHVSGCFQGALNRLGIAFDIYAMTRSSAGNGNAATIRAEASSRRSRARPTLMSLEMKRLPPQAPLREVIIEAIRQGRLAGARLRHEECANSESPAASPKPNPPRFGKEPGLE
jgi:hypothetical protein